MGAHERKKCVCENPLYSRYGFGLCLASIMFYHNILQIGENSEGEEGAFTGDSDFRKLSLLLIITWIPFPLWFSLSIEGFGVITDYLIIEMGWVVSWRDGRLYKCKVN